MLSRVSRDEEREIQRLQSRERLRKSINTRLRTTMIGSIDAIENVMGFLWRQGSPKGTLTEAELEMDSLREELRNIILDLGNAQIRAIERELDQYEIDRQEYTYLFKQESR